MPKTLNGDMLNAMDISANLLIVMSGYRTPYYNASIGNRKYSRHIYGDVDNNSVIDDLNKDGKASMEDAIKMYHIVEGIDNDTNY